MTIEDMLNVLETPRKQLTKWEEDFVESVKEQFEERGTLTDKQVEVLEKICKEKT